MKAFPYLQASVEQLSFGRSEDREQFEKELTHLLADASFAGLVRPGAIESLNRLHLRLAANRGPLAAMLGARENSLLSRYFQEFLRAGLSWPEGGIAIERFVDLAAKICLRITYRIYWSGNYWIPVR